MFTPKPRGELSQALFGMLRAEPVEVRASLDVRPTDDDDLHICLWVMYELMYRGFDDVDDRFEWHPAVLELRRALEQRFEDDLRAAYSRPPLPDPFPEALAQCIEDDDGQSVSTFIQRDAELEQVLTFLRFKSIYHLKESDPTTWVIPRLSVGSKAALMELQYDEYGCGDPNRLHSHLFARGLEACGLCSEYGAYIDDVPVEVLSQNNAWSLFGLHRRLRGAALGHLAAFEATSSLPSRRISGGMSRLGLPAEMIRYYDEHVVADAVHEQLAIRTICGAVVDAEPLLAPDVVFGAMTCLGLEDTFARRMLQDWSA